MGFCSCYIVYRPVKNISTPKNLLYGKDIFSFCFKGNINLVNEWLSLLVQTIDWSISWIVAFSYVITCCWWWVYPLIPVIEDATSLLLGALTMGARLVRV